MCALGALPRENGGKFLSDFTTHNYVIVTARCMLCPLSSRLSRSIMLEPPNAVMSHLFCVVSAPHGFY